MADVRSTDPRATADQNGRAAAAYILTWLTGLIVFLTAKKDERYARWHAVQAIGLGGVGFVAATVLNIISMAFTAMGNPIRPFGTSQLLSLGMFAWLAVLLLVVVLAVKAYKGQTLRIPGLASFADRYA